MQMTKKVVSVILAVMMVVSMMSVMAGTSVSAYTGTINSSGNLDVNNAEDFIAALQDGAVRYVKLTGDFEIPSGTADIDIVPFVGTSSGQNAGKKVIALNGHTVNLGTTVIKIGNGENLSVNGANNGTMLAQKRFFYNEGTLTIQSGIYKTTNGLANHAAIRNDDGGTLSIQLSTRIELTGAGILTVKNSTVNITGNPTITTTAEAFVLAGNGSADWGGYTMNVKGGTLSSEGIAVYHPNLGTLNIEGGTITGATGVYVKAGVTNISGGTISGTGAKSAYDPNNNGAEATGEAIVFESNYAYAGQQPQGVYITGGTFETTNADSPVGSYAEEKAGQEPLTAASHFIAGGTFNKLVDDACLADSYALVADGDNYKAESGYAAKVDDTSYATIDAAVAAAGETKTIILLGNAAYQLPADAVIKVNKNGYTFDATSAVPDHYVTSSVSGDVTTYTSTKYAVKYEKNNTVQYLTGSEFNALPSLADGATYTLLTDFTNFGSKIAGNNSTLDLNGHSINDSNAVNSSTEPLITLGNKTFNIVDSSEAGTGTISRADTSVPFIEVTGSDAVLNIDDVDVSAIKVDDAATINVKDAAITSVDAAAGAQVNLDNSTAGVTCPENCEVVEDAEGNKTVVFNPVTAQFTKSPAAYKVNVGSTISNVYVKLYKNGTALTNVENAAEKDNWELVINDDTAAEITRKSVAAQITYSVKGLKAGEYTLTFRNVNDYDNKATATLTVSNVFSLTWSNTGTKLVENGAVTLTTAKFNGEVVDLNDYNLTFDDPTIATFDGTTLTPLKAGTMKITATSKSDPSVSASANVVFKNAVATDGTAYYESLSKALTGVADGGTVTLLQDTTESVHYTGAEKNMTLDLNGKTLTGSSQYAIRVDRGVLTVEDNSDAQTGTVHYGSDYAFVVSHVAAECESKIILKSGTFIGKTTVAQAGASGGSGANKKYYGGDLEVLGGTFITEADTNETYDTNGNFKFTLNKLDYSDAAYPGGKYSESNIVVKGGTFKQFDPFNNMAEGASTNFVDPEYKSNFVEVGNGEYTVVPKTYLAQVGETKYETLDEAVAAAIASGNDIYLLDACNKAPNNTFNKLTVDATTTFVVRGNGFYGASFAAKTDIANGAWVNTWTISGSGKNAVYTYTIEAAALVVLDDQGEVDHYPTALYQALNGTSGVRATSGQTVKLLDNINLDANKSVIKTSESDVTLDLNGKTLTGVREDFLEVTNGKTLNIENGTIAGTGNVKVGEGSTLNLDGATVGNIEAGAGATITFANSAGITGDVSVPEGYKVVTDETTGTKTVVAKTYLAQVGETKYETFADALAAAQDGDTIELLDRAEIDANTTIDKDVTIDLGGKVLFSETYRMSINSANTVTVKNGRVSTRQITLGSGAVLNVESDAEIRSADRYAVVVYDATLNSTGKINCDASMFLTTYAISLEHQNGIVNINGGKVDATYAISQSNGTSNITDGVLTGSSNTFDYHGGTVNVSGGQFSVPVKQEYCADGYIPVQTKNSAGYYTVEKGDPANPLNPLKVAADAISDGNKFGLGNIDYLKGAILGVQKKNKASVDASETSQSKQETGKDIRFVAVLDTDIINDPDVTDYGFVLAKVGSDKTTENANFNGLKAFWGNGEKTVSAKNTKNNVCSSNTAYGDTTDSSTPYKYITCAVNGVGEGVDGIKVAARFYVKKGDKIYYGKYAKNNYEGGYTGVIAGWADVQE